MQYIILFIFVCFIHIFPYWYYKKNDCDKAILFLFSLIFWVSIIILLYLTDPARFNKTYYYEQKLTNSRFDIQRNNIMH